MFVFTQHRTRVRRVRMPYAAQATTAWSACACGAGSSWTPHAHRDAASRPPGLPAPGLPGLPASRLGCSSSGHADGSEADPARLACYGGGVHSSDCDCDCDSVGFLGPP